MRLIYWLVKYFIYIVASPNFISSFKLRISVINYVHGIDIFTTLIGLSHSYSFIINIKSFIYIGGLRALILFGKPVEGVDFN